MKVRCVGNNVSLKGMFLYPTDVFAFFFSPKNYTSEESIHYLFSTLSLSIHSKKHKSWVTQKAGQGSRGSSFTQTPDLETFCSSGKHTASGYETEPNSYVSPGKMQSEIFYFSWGYIKCSFPAAAEDEVKAPFKAEKKQYSE